MIEGGVTYLVRTDHIGRPVFATNTSGVKVWTATYDPFGGVRTTTGTPINARFPGQWFQSESGLHQNWMRDYDPTTGRYLQADPLGLVDGASVYGYALQSPMMYTDPTGEFIPALVFVAAFLGYILTPEGANAPGYCDELIPPDPLAPFINGVGAGLTFGAGGLFAGGVKSLTDDALKAAAAGTSGSLSNAAGAIEFGKGLPGVANAASNLTRAAVQAMKAQGVTRHQLRAFEELYRRAIADGTGGLVAAERLKYVQNILKLW